MRDSRRPWLRLVAAGAVSALLLFGVLLALSPAATAPGAVDRYVSVGGADVGDCALAAAPCATVQYAVDVAAAGDRVLVAAGLYTGVQTRAGTTQTVYLSKTLTLLGGYDAGFGPRDPETQLSILSAQDNGRVFYIAGTASPVIDGFVIADGDCAAGGDVPRGGNILALGDAGPGLTVTLRNNVISQGTAPSGSGLGGGIATIFTNLRVEDSEFLYNEAGGGGGALHAEQSNLYISDTVVRYNIANTAGGMFLGNLTSTAMTNTVLADNTAANVGTHIVAAGAYIRGVHLTVARGGGGADNAIYGGVGSLVHNSVISLTNTILVSHTRAITVSGGGMMMPSSRAMLDGVLWYGNGENVGGAGIITVTNAYTGAPAFAGDGYHLLPGSAAVGRGVPTTVLLDLDGEPRIGAPDLGADELVVHAYLPLTLHK